MNRPTPLHPALAALTLTVALAGASCSKTASGESASAGAGAMANRALLKHAAYPLKLSADKRYLVDQRGEPFLVQGDTAWSLIVQLERDDAETYLANREARGVNLILVNLLEHKFSDDPPNNAYDQAPFTSEGDFLSPNRAYFAHADWVLRRAGEHGIAVLLAPTYLGYGGGDEGFYREMVAAGPAKLRQWGRFLGARYHSFPNLIWLEGGDYTPPASGLALVDAVAHGIKETDPIHLHAAHWGPETSASEVKVGGWLDVDTTYTYEPVYLKSLSDYARNHERPRLLVESAYETAPNRLSTPQAMRAQAYYAVLTGAVGQIYGHDAIWKFSSGWEDALGAPGGASLVHLKELLAPRAWASLEPDDRRRTLVAGNGAPRSRDYAVLARSRDGELAIAYLPSAREVAIDLSTLAGPVRARWYDPTSGAFQNAAAAVWSTTGVVKSKPPAKNRAGDSDWVLVIEAAP